MSCDGCDGCPLFSQRPVNPAEYIASGLPPLCKHKRTRELASTVLAKLCRGHKPFVQQLLGAAVSQLSVPVYSNAVTGLSTALVKKDSWELSDVHSKSSNGFVGLRNLGCTCYMNATMQQLFNIPALRAVSACNNGCPVHSRAVYDVLERYCSNCSPLMSRSRMTQPVYCSTSRCAFD